MSFGIGGECNGGGGSSFIIFLILILLILGFCCMPGCFSKSA
ncbi:MAG: hypothetical protein WC364_07715 [Eubacteriales bacterium]|jgi:hypothetical protein